MEESNGPFYSSEIYKNRVSLMIFFLLPGNHLYTETPHGDTFMVQLLFDTKKLFPGGTLRIHSFVIQINDERK